MPKLKAKKLNMQPGDAAKYEAEARAYFESLRHPFEETLRASRTNFGKWFRPPAWIDFLLFLSAWSLSTNAIRMFLFHRDKFTFGGKAYQIDDLAGYVAGFSIGAMVLMFALYGVLTNVQLSRVAKPLSERVMVFALSYAIFRELESGERSSLSHHHQKAVELWAKLLTYLRWTLHGDVSPDTAHFHKIPKSDFPLASQAQHLASALNWSSVAKPEYGVITALNSLHTKLSPRIKDAQDIAFLEEILRGIGNFFYTTIIQSHDESQAVWGYGELLRASEIINHLATPPKPEPAPPLISSKLFVNDNLIVAFFAWWTVFQALFIALIMTAFRIFPTLTMNSQAMVTLIAGPIAAAVSMVVGISRKTHS